MLEFLFAVAAASALLGLLFWVLSHSKVPSYRPSRQAVLKLLVGIEAGTTSQSAWDLFISYPILHDEPLELIRRRCVALVEGDEDSGPCSGGLGEYIFDKQGRQRVTLIRTDLEKLMAQPPRSRSF